MISLIVPTYNCGPNLGHLISSLKAQSTDCEPIIVDSTSSDGTQQIAFSEGAKVVAVRQADFNHGKTRNIGARQTVGEVLVFLTQDAVPCDGRCLENLIKPLDDPRIVAAFGRQIPRPDASPIEKFARLYNYPETPMVKGKEDLPRLGIKTFFFSNVCSAIKTKEFKELGGFPENIIMFEDLIFAAKAIMAGYKIAYVPEAAVWHSHNFSLVQQFRRYRDAGRSLRNYPWILEYGKADREGIRFLRREISYLVSHGHRTWIPYALAESVFKFMGFWIGLHGRKLVQSCAVNTAAVQKHA